MLNGHELLFHKQLLKRSYNSLSTTSATTDMFNCGVNYLGDSGSATATARNYYVNCLITIRLQDLFDIFKHVDLCVNPNFKITATLNTMKATMTIATETRGTLVHNSYNYLEILIPY